MAGRKSEATVQQVTFERGTLHDPVSIPTSLSPQPITQKYSLGIRQPISE